MAEITSSPDEDLQSVTSRAQGFITLAALSSPSPVPPRDLVATFLPSTKTGFNSVESRAAKRK